jgi:hypothetical protein
MGYRVKEGKGRGGEGREGMGKESRKKQTQRGEDIRKGCRKVNMVQILCTHV